VCGWTLAEAAHKERGAQMDGQRSGFCMRVGLRKQNCRRKNASERETVEQRTLNEQQICVFAGLV